MDQVEVIGEQASALEPEAAFEAVRRGLERTLKTYAVPEVEGSRMRWEGSPDGGESRYAVEVTAGMGTVLLRLSSDTRNRKLYVTILSFALLIVWLGAAAGIYVEMYTYGEAYPQIVYVGYALIALISVFAVLSIIVTIRRVRQKAVENARAELQHALDWILADLGRREEPPAPL